MHFINSISLLLIISLSCVSLSSGDSDSVQSIKINIADGSTTWWFGMSFTAASSLTSSVAFTDSSSYTSWTELKPTKWSSSVFEFITTGNPVQLPLSVRLISSSGNTLILMKSITALSSGLVIDTDADYASTATTSPQQTYSSYTSVSSSPSSTPSSSSTPASASSPKTSNSANKPALPGTEATATPYTADSTATIRQTVPYKGIAEASSPMSPCFSGRSSWYSDSLHSGSCGYGNLLGPTGPGHTYVAAASVSMFGISASCGDCFQITGPIGAVIVTVVDSCSASRCSDGIPHLDLSPDAFDAIANRNQTSTVYTNYRKVTCPVLGNVKVTSLAKSASDIEYRIFNHRVSISNATVSTSDSRIINLSRTSNNTWKYQGTSSLAFPVTLTVRSENNNVITHQFTTSAYDPSVVDTSSQISGVPRSYGGSNTNAACVIPTGLTTPIIYSDKLTTDSSDLGWQDWSFASSIDWDYRVNPYKGSSCIKAKLDAYGAIQLARNVGIQWANDYTHLQFYIRSDSEFNQLRVDWNNGYETLVSVTPVWTIKNISLASMKAPTNIGANPNTLMFNTALASGIPTIYIDELQLVKL
eukprot:TRINITY_DN6742_c0_g1_i1.p1 TRINITY_DN6742_c0_g1~~TRINITY_DN6742_c0_g1_i1.p1  ORF type:complete len:588 (-),score=165.86 TRINITY_DN6742_c0_g1_i1:90-1853(-)